MALTVRQNGSATINIIQAQWFNDYHDLLRGIMTDQPVLIANSLTLEGIWPPATALTLALASGTSLGVGLYSYAYSYVNADGAETSQSASATITTTANNQVVSVSAITAGPAGIVSRKLYRSKVGGGQLYYLATINDNTTTTYTDTAADGSLGSAAILDPSHGGIIFLDPGGSLQGYISGSHPQGKLALVGNGRVELQIGFGTPIVYADAAGVHILGGGTTGLYLQDTNGSTPSRIITGTAGFGVKMSNGTKIFEVKSNGNAVISGSTYSTGGSGFDGFDFAECYETDQEYTSGTVVCPIGPQKMGKCTHDGCPAASIISDTPGFLAGSPHPEYQPIAVVGKVQAKTAYNIPLRSVVCSDGRGGVRPLKPGEWAYTLGYVIEPTDDKGMVGIVIRNMLAKG